MINVPIPTDFSEKHFKFKKIVTSDNLVTAINKTIKSNTIAFVVIGTKDATHAERRFIGTYTQDVIKKVQDIILINFKTPNVI